MVFLFLWQLLQVRGHISSINWNQLLWLHISANKGHISLLSAQNETSHKPHECGHSFCNINAIHGTSVTQPPNSAIPVQLRCEPEIRSVGCNYICFSHLRTQKVKGNIVFRKRFMYTIVFWPDFPLQQLTSPTFVILALICRISATRHTRSATLNC